MRRLVAAGALAVLATLAMLVGAAPAFAHAQFEGSDPADGASLATGPQTVTLTFSDTMQQGFNTITVTGPDGAQYQAAGDPKAQDTTVSIGVNPLGPAGVYQIGYRVLSDDGHPITGQIGFTLTQPGPGAGTQAAAPTAAAPTSQAPVAQAAQEDQESGGMPVWPWIVGAIVLVAAGVVVAMRLGRSS
ncbi:copper resistance CopC family protein [Pseudonocardia sp. WMMC193]|uniref:copper resistance CopC family protein n=1 Tax=Pseudonocardia sp. WMMC193 TaxID=2911965 RepID=UPI001F33420B|nr:copper resistance CopC family protein [Pseudonocardia sp. WMMC193]MCF7551887.1 copper resistance protein CopC [Pseudonocardia sp. WMMC193]